MYKTKSRSFKQERASVLNWNKARLMSASEAVTSAHDNLMKYNISPCSISSNLLRIEFLLAECLKVWDKQVWEGVKDE